MLIRIEFISMYRNIPFIICKVSLYYSILFCFGFLFVNDRVINDFLRSKMEGK